MPTAAVPENSGPVAAAANNDNAAATNRAKPQFGAEIFASLPQSFFLMIMFHVIFMMPSNPGAKHGAISAPGSKMETPRSAVGPNLPPPTMHLPLWKLEEKFEMFVYLSATNQTLNQSDRSSSTEGGFMVIDTVAGTFLPGALPVNGEKLLWHEVCIV